MLIQIFNLHYYLKFINKTYINFILALTNVFGIFSIKICLKKQKFKAYLLSLLVFFSSIHHLVETNEAGHNLPGISIPVLSNYGDIIRYIDMILAYCYFIFLLKDLGVKKILICIDKRKYFIFSLFSCSFICDFIIFNKPDLYLFLHAYWHIGIYYIIYHLQY